LTMLDINGRWFYPLGALAMASFMVGVLYGPAGALPWLEGKFANLTATLAYSLYLTHMAAAPLALRLPRSLQAPGFVVLAYAIAIVLYIAVERPCLARMRRAPATVARRPPTVQPGGGYGV